VRAIDLFSCIGGHALGLQAAGVEVVGLCELHPQRRAFLQSQFPNIRVHDDIHTLDAVRGGAELLTGGPPCQRTSVGAAIHGYRSGASLWGQMLRFGRMLDPAWWVVEQPPGDEGWETAVCTDLGEAGYAALVRKLSAVDLGAPYPRRRVFILACRSRARLEIAWEAVPWEAACFAGSAAAGNHWFAGPPAGLRVADGFPSGLDRNAAVEAIGDSNPPGMMTVIARAILRAEQSGA
jgi:DNA (cytosine-5)-methyltransferase 1